MTQLSELQSCNFYPTLPSAFFTRHAPQAIENPRLVIKSDGCAKQLGIAPESISNTVSLDILSGAAVPSSWQPIAMKYFGHQFGYLNPDLGDGRGLLLAQTKNQQGEVWDLHLKGAGTTNYSRGGDGRAVLRSSIREFLASEALAALRIPTTRALAVVASDTPVYRETEERAATLLRVARSHIRFGHFEFAYHSKDKRLTEQLARYVVERHYPCLVPNETGFADMFRLICESTARMIIDWQSFGFAHGVMNTDNMSIIGDTFDFGPYGFMDRFRSNYICNHSDHQGRYAFDRQPAIAHWNLSVLAQALTPILNSEQLNAGISAFSDVFNAGFVSRMRSKLGLYETQAEDSSFIFETLQTLQNCRLDYSFFFRKISNDDLELGLESIRNEAIDINAFDHWANNYKTRLTAEDQEQTARAKEMRSENPARILRNNLAQDAIEAAERGDYSVVNRLHESLLSPFEDNPEYSDLAALPPKGSEELEISCSS